MLPALRSSAEPLRGPRMFAAVRHRSLDIDIGPEPNEQCSTAASVNAVVSCRTGTTGGGPITGRIEVGRSSNSGAVDDEEVKGWIEALTLLVFRHKCRLQFAAG